MKKPIRLLALTGFRATMAHCNLTNLIPHNP